MEKKDVKEILAYLLSSFRARLAIQDVSEGCPFDYHAFLEACSAIKSEAYLSRLLSVNLDYLVQQGLLNSLLPYLKSSFKSRKLPLAICSGKPDPALLALQLQQPASSRAHLVRSRQTPERVEDDPEIVIHVCDESKGIWKDFSCRQSVLLKGMSYFSRVTVKGQRLQDMDISVHCEIGIFDWLLQWIHHDQGQVDSSTVPEPSIDALSVIGLVVSADFLLMPSLTTNCLLYLYDHIEHVIRDSPNLGCLSETLTRRLTSYFSNIELETRIAEIDRTDRLTSRLYIQFILLMNAPDPNPELGHFGSTASLFKCKACHQLLTNEMAPIFPCNTVKFDCLGRHYSSHTKDSNWTLPIHIRETKRELKTWRRVYWRLWGTVNYFFCSACNFYFSARYSTTCKFHPEAQPGKLTEGAAGTSTFGEIKSQAFHKYFHRKSVEPVKELPEATPQEQEPQPQGIRKLPCCKVPSYRFTPLPHAQGCQHRDHMPAQLSSAAIEKLEIYNQFRELITQEEESPYWSITMISFTSEKSWNLNKTLDEPKSKHDLEPESGDCCSGSEDGATSGGNNASARQDRGAELLWSWNPELTTRYNQDMQRELEEKYMVHLCSLLAQRIPIVAQSNIGGFKF